MCHGFNDNAAATSTFLFKTIKSGPTYDRSYLAIIDVVLNEYVESCIRHTKLLKLFNVGLVYVYDKTFSSSFG